MPHYCLWTCAVGLVHFSPFVFHPHPAADVWCLVGKAGIFNGQICSYSRHSGLSPALLLTSWPPSQRHSSAHLWNWNNTGLSMPYLKYLSPEVSLNLPFILNYLLVCVCSYLGDKAQLNIQFPFHICFIDVAWGLNYTIFLWCLHFDCVSYEIRFGIYFPFLLSHFCSEHLEFWSISDTQCLD